MSSSYWYCRMISSYVFTYNYMYINNLKVKSVDKHERKRVKKQKRHLYKMKQTTIDIQSKHHQWYIERNDNIMKWATRKTEIIEVSCFICLIMMKAHRVAVSQLSSFCHIYRARKWKSSQADVTVNKFNFFCMM